MGKKSRKLRSPKYAAKASAFRETVARLRENRSSKAREVNNTTPEEDNITQTVDKIVEEIETSFCEVKEPVVAEVPIVQTTKTPNALRKIAEKTEEKNVEQEKKSTTKKKATTSTTRKKSASSTTKKTTTTTRRRRTAKTKTPA